MVFCQSFIIVVVVSGIVIYVSLVVVVFLKSSCTSCFGDFAKYIVVVECIWHSEGCFS